MFKFFFSLIFALLFSVFLQADLISDQLKEAESSYDEALYDKSIEVYEGLIKRDKVSGPLFFNLGNAYYREGNLGKSVASYLAAKRYLPRDPDLAHNLKFVHSKSRDQLAFESEGGALSVLTNWFKNFTKSEVESALVFLILISTLFMILFHFVKKLASFRPLGHGAFVVTFFLFSFYSFTNSSLERWGAVTVEIVKVQSGPGLKNTTLFELHEGAPFIYRDSQGEWCRIELSDGKKGWVTKDSIAVY